MKSRHWGKRKHIRGSLTLSKRRRKGEEILQPGTRQSKKTAKKSWETRKLPRTKIPLICRWIKVVLEFIRLQNSTFVMDCILWVLGRVFFFNLYVSSCGNAWRSSERESRGRKAEQTDAFLGNVAHCDRNVVQTATHQSFFFPFSPEWKYYDTGIQSVKFLEKIQFILLLRGKVWAFEKP